MSRVVLVLLLLVGVVDENRSREDALGNEHAELGGEGVPAHLCFRSGEEQGGIE
jgi:hypothetical protein